MTKQIFYLTFIEGVFYFMITYKQNILRLLKNHGYSAYRLRKDKIMSAERIQRLRRGALPSWRELAIICQLTGESVSDLIEYAPDQARAVSYKLTVGGS